MTHKIIILILSFFLWIPGISAVTFAEETIPEETVQEPEEENIPEENEGETSEAEEEPEAPVETETPEGNSEEERPEEENSETAAPDTEEETPETAAPLEEPVLSAEETPEPEGKPEEKKEEKEEPEEPEVLLPSGILITSAADVSGSDYTDRPLLAMKLDEVFSGSIGMTDGLRKNVEAPLGSYAVPPGTVFWACAREHSGESCFIYALGVYYTLFGEDPYLHRNHSETVHAASKIRYASKETFEQAGIRNAPGAYFRTYKHSLIVLGYDEAGIDVVQGNVGENGLVCITEYTWDEFNAAILYSGEVGVEVVYQPTDAYYDETYPVFDPETDNFRPKAIQGSHPFIYDEDHFFTDPLTADPELAKTAMALSAAAYSRSALHTALKAMGFAEGNIHMDHYDSESLKAGYSAARKQIHNPYGRPFELYLITIGGKPADAWLENYLNTPEGSVPFFFEEADEILNKVNEIRNTESEEEKALPHILFVTGHGYGGALANIIAARLSKEQNTDQVYGYTFAAPLIFNTEAAQGMDIHGYTNIHNYISPHDVLAKLNPGTSVYARAGEDILLNADENDPVFRNFKNRFLAVKKQEYALAARAEELNALIHNEVEKQYLARIISEKISASSTHELLAVLSEGMLSALNEERMDDMIRRLISDELYDPVTELNQLKRSLTQLYEETKDLSYEEREAWLLQEIHQEQTGLLSGMLSVSDLNMDAESCQKLIQSLDDAITFFTDTDRETFRFLEKAVYSDAAKILKDGSDADTYELWINSAYFGSYGWQGWSDPLPDLTSSSAKTIGEYCFADTKQTGVLDLSHFSAVGPYAFLNSSFESLILGDSMETLGRASFASMSRLQSVRLPCDFLYTWDGSFDCSPFEADAAITEIIYTKGSEGKIPESGTRIYRFGREGASGKLSAGGRLEQIAARSLAGIIYEEGVAIPLDEELNAEQLRTLLTPALTDTLKEGTVLGISTSGQKRMDLIQNDQELEEILNRETPPTYLCGYHNEDAEQKASSKGIRWISLDQEEKPEENTDAKPEPETRADKDLITDFLHIPAYSRHLMTASER